MKHPGKSIFLTARIHSLLVPYRDTRVCPADYSSLYPIHKLIVYILEELRADMLGYATLPILMGQRDVHKDIVLVPAT